MGTAFAMQQKYSIISITANGTAVLWHTGNKKLPFKCRTLRPVHSLALPQNDLMTNDTMTNDQTIVAFLPPRTPPGKKNRERVGL